MTGQLARRGTSNRDVRGNSRNRAARRAWLLAKYGDGVTAPCYRCAAPLTNATITVDRVVPGARGGTYRRSNIRPACGPCNSETGGTVRRLVLVTLDPDDPAQMTRLHLAIVQAGGPTQPASLSAACSRSMRPPVRDLAELLAFVAGYVVGWLLAPLLPDPDTT